MFRFGIDRLVGNPAPLAGKRAALLSHPAGVTSDLTPSWRALVAAGAPLVQLFGPEHGIDGGAQDMVSVGDSIHKDSGLPARSLYGSSFASLSPSPEDLAGIDVLICDLQDVGARYYTFVWTVCLALEACATAGKAVVICDRPNPLGGGVEGEIQEPEYLSFVGLHPVPVRHGLTVGEIALLYARQKRLNLDLRVIPMEGWSGPAGWPESVSWISPSPNMPSLATARVYPGGCLFEATNLSEGRGTTRPFEQVGAPFLDAAALAQVMNGMNLPGVHFVPVHFQPAARKFAGEMCHGVFVAVTGPETFRSYETYLRLMREIRCLAPENFSWRHEPYEFENRPAIDLLTGSSRFRELMDDGAEISGFCLRQRNIHFSPERIYPSRRPAVIGIAGAHNAGKTTLAEKMIGLFRARGLRAGAIKHTPHDVEDDLAGKDSSRLLEAGASPTAFIRPAAMTIRQKGEVELDRLIARDFADCDLVFVEGFKSLPLLRIEVGRQKRFGVEFERRDFTGELKLLAEEIVRVTRSGPPPFEIPLA